MATIKGFNAAINQLKNLRKQQRQAVQRGILKTAKLIEADAKANVPVDLGALQASIGIEQKPETTYIFADKPYAAFQEFGTGPLVSIPKGYEAYAREFFRTGKGTTNPQPFLFPALFKYQETLVPNVDEELQKLINKL